MRRAAGPAPCGACIMSCIRDTRTFSPDRLQPGCHNRVNKEDSNERAGNKHPETSKADRDCGGRGPDAGGVDGVGRRRDRLERIRRQGDQGVQRHDRRRRRAGHEPQHAHRSDCGARGVRRGQRRRSLQPARLPLQRQQHRIPRPPLRPRRRTMCSSACSPTRRRTRRPTRAGARCAVAGHGARRYADRTGRRRGRRRHRRRSGRRGGRGRGAGARQLCPRHDLRRGALAGVEPRHRPVAAEQRGGRGQPRHRRADRVRRGRRDPGTAGPPIELGAT